MASKTKNLKNFLSFTALLAKRARKVSVLYYFTQLAYLESLVRPPYPQFKCTCHLRACHSYYLKFLLAQNELIHHAKVLKNKMQMNQIITYTFAAKKDTSHMFGFVYKCCIQCLPFCRNKVFISAVWIFFNEVIHSVKVRIELKSS